jgi:membrane fusion protein (multidrug efflux system)
VVHLAAQAGGRVTDLPVRDHAHVEQGQLLLTIDPEPYAIAVRRAEANLDLARQASAAADTAVTAARARLAEQEAAYEDAGRNDSRMQTLVKRKSVAQAKADSAGYRLREAKAALSAARAELETAVRAQDEAGARVRVAEAARAAARLDLSHTRLTAPAAGVLGEIAVRPGDVITAGQQLFPLVEDRTFWVDANFKETELSRIRTGQPATVSVDMYPGRIFRGKVESLSPASGVAFSLLPPENATGNWVKVTQRFPVRVSITDTDVSLPLRIGASSSVSVDTGARAPVAAAAAASARPVEISDASQP